MENRSSGPIKNTELPKAEQAVGTLSSEQEKNIQEVFKLNPELEKIGTQEQYQEYLETIFPESKVKDVVFHGTRHSFEEFKGSDFFFTKDIALASHVANYSSNGENEARIIPTVLNAQKVWHYEKEGNGMEMANFHFDRFIKQGYDTFINSREIAVIKSNQIHILGSKVDIEKFKEFVSKIKE